MDGACLQTSGTCGKNDAGQGGSKQHMSDAEDAAGEDKQTSVGQHRAECQGNDAAGWSAVGRWKQAWVPLITKYKLIQAPAKATWAGDQGGEGHACVCEQRDWWTGSQPGRWTQGKTTCTSVVVHGHGPESVQ